MVTPDTWPSQSFGNCMRGGCQQIMWVDSSDLCGHSSSFIHHIATANLSPGMSEKHKLSCPNGIGELCNMLHKLMDSALSTPEVLIILMHEDAWAHASQNTLYPDCVFLYVEFCIAAWWNFIFMPHQSIFRACYLDLSSVRNVAITCKSSIHNKKNLKSEAVRKGGTNKNNEQKQGRTEQPTLHLIINGSL